MGTSSHEANDDDLRRAKKLLNTLDKVELPDAAESLTFPDLVSQLLDKNRDARHAADPRSQTASRLDAGTRASDLFMSYPTPARHRVVPICKALVSAGHSVFFDYESLQGGDEFAEVIDQELRGAHAVVACWSPLSFKSRWCRSEWRVGRHQNKLIPIAIEPFSFDEIPTEFNGIHYLDFTDFSGSVNQPCFEKLLSAFRRLLVG